MIGLLSAPAEYAPPEEILHHPERLKEHFDSVNRRNGSPGGNEEILHDPTVDVSAAAAYRKKMGLVPA